MADMNIYHVEWLFCGEFDLSAVVIAPSEGEALKELDLTDGDTEVKVSMVGACSDGTASKCVICREYL